MHLKNFNLILMLIAGIIVGIVSIIANYSIERLMITLIIVLLLFFCIGSIIQLITNNIFDASDKEKRNKEIAELEEEELALTQESVNRELTDEEQEE